MKPLVIAVILISIKTARCEGSGWNSEIVKYNKHGELSYSSDSDGNRIPDFSNAGYRGGGVELPDVPEVKRIAPVAGDNTASLQAALDEIAKLPLRNDGFRGALVLQPGVYELQGTLHMSASGVVLRGAGQSSDPKTNSVLLRKGRSTDPVILAGVRGGGDFKTEIPDTATDITTSLVHAGSRSFEVADAAKYHVGDNIVIEHPSTEAWLKAIDGGGTGKDAPWKPGEIDIRYHRYITKIDGNTINIDAPVFGNLDRSLSQSRTYRYDDSKIRREIGIEDLLIDIETSGEHSEDHAQNGVIFTNAENCWIRKVDVRHFVHSGIEFGPVCTRSTAESCQAIEPHGPVDAAGLPKAGSRYNFGVFHAQLILFENCYASFARHAFISNGGSLDSGIVVLDCTNDHSYLAAEGHRRWPQGLLFDGYHTQNPITGLIILGFYNRGSFGTGHGWGAINSVAWRCDMAGRELAVQKPPTAQNYAIGCFGRVDGIGKFPEPAGYIEGTDKSGLEPKSLYRAQLAERLGGRKEEEKFSENSGQ